MAQNGQIIADGTDILSPKKVSYSSQVVTLANVLATSTQLKKAPHQVIAYEFNPTPTPGLHHQGTPWIKALEADIAQAKQTQQSATTIVALQERLTHELALRNQLIGLFDVMCKLKINRFVQALSGGMDSAFNALKVYLMVQLVVKEIGLNNMLIELHAPEHFRDEMIRQWNNQGLDEHACGDNLDTLSPEVENSLRIVAANLLSCYSLSTQNNSLETKKAAETFMTGGSFHDLVSGQLVAFKGVPGGYANLDIQSVVDSVLFAFTGIDGLAINEAQKEQIIAKLHEFSRLPRHNIQEIYNELYHEDLKKYGLFLASTWPAGTEHLDLDEKSAAKKKEEQRLIGALETLFKKEISVILGTEFTGTILSPINPDHGITLENMQARIRQVLIFLLAEEPPEVERELLIGFITELMVNPNQSEACNAYTTLGGDLHAGRISFNSFIEKSVQIQQMQHLYRYGLCGVAHPVTSLHYILENNDPTAELQPPDLKTKKVLQRDEKSLKRTYAEMVALEREVFHQRAAVDPSRKQNAIEAFNALRSNELFLSHPIALLCDKILYTYKDWPIAQHKIRCAPVSQTFGSDNIDHEFSLQTPCINAFHGPEQAQMILHCLADMAKEQGSSFSDLTKGYSLDFCNFCALVVPEFCYALLRNLWTESDVAVLGSGTELNTNRLYWRIEQGKKDIMMAFKGLEHYKPLYEDHLRQNSLESEAITFKSGL